MIFDNQAWWIFIFFLVVIGLAMIASLIHDFFYFRRVEKEQKSAANPNIVDEIKKYR